MESQDSIQSSRLGRMATLAGTGAQVGINYLKHYGRTAAGGSRDRTTLHADNADVVYKSFSRLKGGPLKLAQMLSIDKNLLPPAYAAQFAQAQYSAPPLSYPLVVRTFRREFGKEPTEIFSTFSKEAAHGASIGQVHRATLHGRDFAVKVQYPGVAESLTSDLQVVKPIALQILGLKERDVAQYFREVEERLLEETDYELEMRKSIELSEATDRLDGIRFPEYFPEFSSKRILTMSWLDGVPLDRFADGPASQETRDRIGQALWDFYEFQIHELHQFHADPHPGNFLIAGEDLCVLDFGCTKQLDDEFYFKHFRFLDPAMSGDPQLLEAALEDMGILLEQDSLQQRNEITAVCLASIEQLALPFRHGSFDFGDEEFMASIYRLGQENRGNPTLKNMRGHRGSPHGIYVNRAYFGLYSLLVRLRARVNTRLPDWIGGVPV